MEVPATLETIDYDNVEEVKEKPDYLKLMFERPWIE